MCKKGLGADRMYHAELYCDTIGGGGVMDFRAIHDRDKSKGAVKVRGTIGEVECRLVELNELGYGIFATVNETDGEGVREENVVRIRAVWADLDWGEGSKMPELKKKPTMTVKTRNGWHVYYVVDSPDKAWGRAMNKMLAKELGGDGNAVDIARVLRVPGFMHCKKDPFLVEVV